MNAGSSIPNWLTPDRVGAWGRATISLTFLVLTVAWTMMLWSYGLWVGALPIVLLSLAGAIYLVQRPSLNLYVLLAAFILVADFEEGSSPLELLYALAYGGFLFAWFLRYRYLEQKQIIRSALDAAVMFFLVWVTVSFGLTIIHGASLVAAAGEYLAVLMLGSYFPIREAVSRDEHGPTIIVGIIIWLGIFVVVRNLVIFATILGDATMLWQVMSGRVTTNMVLLLLAAIFLLVLLANETSRKRQVVMFAVFIGTLASLVLTQARAYWIDFALGAGLLFLIVRWPQRKRLIGWGITAVAGAVLFGYLLLGDTLWILMTGLFDRLISIGTAAERDISLINRFYEAGHALDYIAESPVIGHGLATQYEAFDLIIHATISKPFAHIGVILLLFKYGAIGLLTVLFFWGRGIWTGAKVFGQRHLPGLHRSYALAAMLSLAALIPSAFTSVPFYLSDSLLGFAMLLGLSEGLRRRYDTR